MIVCHSVLAVAMMIMINVFQCYIHNFSKLCLIYFTNGTIDDFSHGILKVIKLIFQHFQKRTTPLYIKQKIYIIIVKAVRISLIIDSEIHKIYETFIGIILSTPVRCVVYYRLFSSWFCHLIKYCKWRLVDRSSSS